MIFFFSKSLSYKNFFPISLALPPSSFAATQKGGVFIGPIRSPRRIMRIRAMSKRPVALASSSRSSGGAPRRAFSTKNNNNVIGLTTVTSSSASSVSTSAAATEAAPRHSVKPGCPPGLNKYSSKITQPKSQGASQAMLYATGLNEEDMNKPQVRGESEKEEEN